LQEDQKSKRVEIVKEYTFEAAHRLTHVSADHKCGRLHGHSFRLEVKLEGEVDPQTGWLIDFGDISKVVRPIVDDRLDHSYLNEVEGMGNPTSEQIAMWVWDRIKPDLPALTEVVVHETCTARCIYRG
jgi:6-pyruvoyltetrahydropterin/6-carboxytetrahydropterin synthase